MPRDDMIRVSTEEKDRLDRASRELFQTTEVPYGLVVDELASRVIEE